MARTPRRAARMMASSEVELAQQVDTLRRCYELPEAESMARSALKRFPKGVELLIALGRVLLTVHRLADAVTIFEQAVELAPGDDRPVAWKIAALSRQYSFAAAIATGTDALEHHPGSVLIRVALGRVFLDSSRPQDARAYLAEAATIAPADETALSWQAACLAEMCRWPEAEALARESLTLHADSIKLRYRLGCVLLGARRFTEAKDCFDAVVTDAPQHAGALEWRTTALRSLYSFSEAAASAADAISRLPRASRLHAEYGGVFTDRGQYEQALSHVSSALAIDPRDPLALWSRIYCLRLAGRFPEAEQAAAEALAARPDDPGVHTAVAWVFSDQGQYEQALSHVSGALAIDPRNSAALTARIDFLRAARRFPEVEQAAAEALAARPDDPDMHTSASWVYSDQDREDDAAVHAADALAIDPRNSWALRSRIDFLRYARRFPEAEQAAAEALAARPDDPDVHTSASWVYCDQGQYEQALSYISSALAIDSRNFAALGSRINFLRDAHRFPEAEQAAAEALAARPDDPDMHTAAAWVYSVQDREDEAAIHAADALAIDPRNSWALQSRINFLRAARRFPEAEQAAVEGTELRPQDPGIRIELGLVHDAQLKFSAALTHFAVVLDREPDNVAAQIARSATLRSLRRYQEAEREITRLRQLKPANRDLRAELGWIRHDARLLNEAQVTFQGLLDTAVNGRERAEARHSLGWTAFAAGNLTTAEQHFRAAIEDQPDACDGRLGLAWALARQNHEERRREAERLAYEVAERRPDFSAHVCLGVIAFRRGSPASAEYHFQKALELDPYHGSHTDLGALYAQMARYTEAEAELGRAVARDWYDTAAHIELGSLFLELGDRRLDAEREFRQALAADSASGAATIGLAYALAKDGNDAQAESILREALPRQDAGERWRTHLALARLLVQRGDKQQNPDLHTEAYAEAQQAISQAPESEADPHFVAGVAHHRMGTLTAEARGRIGYRRRAMHHLRECLKHDPGHVEAQRNLQLLERELKAAAPAIRGGYAVAVVSLLLLVTMWTMFFLTSKVSTMLLSVNTPVLVGLFTISTLLPTLIRLKLPGFEADLRAGTETISPGPTGDVTFGPGWFTGTTGPTGQVPRHG
jgi:tetratricopeptide (TPR) repeat protein